jgi:hypothetical protein
VDADARGSAGVTRKVIYVSIGRLTDKMARDWCIDYLIGQGACVEYWDIVALMRDEHAEFGALNPAYLRVFRSFDEVEKALRVPGNRDALYVMLITYSGQLARIFQLLSRERCRMLTFAWGALPHESGLSWRRLLARASRPGRSLQQAVNRYRASALRKLGLVAPFQVTFAAGAVSMADSAHASRVVPINYFDYDLYVKAKSNGAVRLVEGRYIVFLDSNLPFHSDLPFCGYPQIDPLPYYRSLNRFFDLLEATYGWRVVIAAHPRADYDTNTFAGRPMHRLMTAELVRDAEFALSHTSTAMSYAVLSAKPLIFIYTGDFAVAYGRTLLREMHCFARSLDAPLCNVDSVVDARQIAVRPVNPSCYERYKYDYLTSPQSENTPTQEIFWREIRAQ